MGKLFKGTVKSINLVSSECFMVEGWLGDDNVIRQTLAIHDDGKVYFNEYLATDENQNIKRHRITLSKEAARAVLDSIGQYFAADNEIICACDAGDWELTITNTEGKKFVYFGAMIPEILTLESITNRLCEILDQNVWGFSGGR